MGSACSKIPDKPGFNSTEKKLTCLGKSLYTGNVVDNPLDFCSREVCVNNKTCVVLDVIAKLLVFLDFFAHISSSSALPNDCIVYGLTGCSIPEDCCFSLVGDADTRNVLG